MKKFICLVGFMLLISACTQNFEALNTNKNAPLTAEENLLLPDVIFSLANLMVRETYVFNDVVAQYAGNYEYNDLDLYRWFPDDRFWTPMYAILQNISDIKKIAKAKKQKNYQAVALILEAYIYSTITDAYGAAPMQEANRTSEGFTAPKYNGQAEIYAAIFEKLDRANTLLTKEQGIGGDILFKGDVEKWQKFANSLHLRFLLKVSKVKNTSAQMRTILADPQRYPIFTSNQDNAIYHYSGTSPDISPIAAPGGGRAYDYFRPIPTTHFIETLHKHKDPRLHLWVSPKKGTDDRTLGVTPGINIGDIGRPAAYSRRSEAFFKASTKINSILMTYSELNFILAEAAEKNMIAGNPKSYYEKAVTASFGQWKTEMPADFLSERAPYGKDNENLYEQKWLALYHCGIEAWLNQKRTGKPSFLKAGAATVNNSKIPLRLKYPGLERSVNEKNYQDALKTMGGADDINAPAWWW